MELMIIPKNFNVSIIKPILKDQDKPTNDINNIRPISISNCFAQMFEKLILINSPNILITHRNQFGFKSKTSCNHAIFALKETILHYTENKSGCKVASLDAEKAFDKTWRDGLFYKLLPNMDITFWYILKIYYDSSEGTILLMNNCLSELFNINVGVKQGGFLSPSLYDKLIDDLIKQCVNEKIGALLHNTNTSILVYANDILLISPNDYHLQKLLDICGKYGRKYTNAECSQKYLGTFSFGADCTGTPACGSGKQCGNVNGMCYCECNLGIIRASCRTTELGYTWNNGIKLSNVSYALNGTKGDGNEYKC